MSAALLRPTGRAGAETRFVPFRSAMPGIVWPAFPNGLGMMMLALQYQLERSERWPAERLRAHQQRQLARLLEHAARESAFYRARLGGAGLRPGEPFDAAAWARLPILTRRELQQHGHALRTAPPPTHGAVSIERSSGSTGMPVEVATTALAAMLNEAISLRDHLWHGRDFSGRIAVIRRPRAGETVDVPMAGWTRGVSAAVATGGSVLFDALRPMAEQLDWLMRQDPDHLITYPSILGELLREAERRRLRPSRLKSVLTQSEQASPHLRDTLRAAWGVSLTDTYSASEAGVMALQCPQSGQYHVQAEVALVEVLGADGRPCAPGEMGRVVVTPLHSFAQPLIRYDIGDLAEVGAPCACGRGLPTLARIIGRATATLVLPSGALVLPHFDTAFAKAALPIVQFQVVQRSRERLEARLVVERGLDAAEEEKLRRLLHAACGVELAVDFSYHDALARGPGGKFAAFYSEVPHS